jgi:dTDP-4-amino-4,6-dideoxygalactose transaminase
MSFGAIGATSFFPSKPLGCYGDGGAVFTNDAATAQLLRSLRCHGQGAHKYENVRLGWNSRLDTLQAAVLLQKLSIFADEMRARERIARLYAALLGERVTTPTIPADMVSSWAQYTIVLSNRDRTAADLQRAGIPTAVYYPVPLHKQPAFANYPRLDDLTRSEWLSAHVLSLPMHPYLTEETQRYIADSVLQAEYA